MRKDDAEDLREEARTNREGFSEPADPPPAKPPVLLEGLPRPRGQLRPARRTGARR